MRTPMITDSNSTASQSQTLTLSGPVKYSPVMRQNCLPHVVNRPISTRITSVATAAITQALAIHHSDVQQLVAPVQRRGEHIVHSGKVPRQSAGSAARRSQLLVGSGSSRHSPSPTSSR